MKSPIDRATEALTTAEEWSSFFSEEDARKLVFAVLHAIREPSDDMVEAGMDELDGVEDSDFMAIWMWRAMVDAAMAQT